MHLRGRQRDSGRQIPELLVPGPARIHRNHDRADAAVGLPRKLRPLSLKIRHLSPASFTFPYHANLFCNCSLTFSSTHLYALRPLFKDHPIESWFPNATAFSGCPSLYQVCTPNRFLCFVLTGWNFRVLFRLDLFRNPVTLFATKDSDKLIIQ